MSYLQIAITSGALIGFGLTLIIWRLVPAQPHLGAALERLNPTSSDTGRDGVDPGATLRLRDRLGIWVQRRLPLTTLITPPIKDLAVLRVPVHQYWGEKALFFLVGLVAPPMMALAAAFTGLHPPVVLPAAGSLLLAVVLSFLPDYNARTDAAAARTEFSRALSAYIELTFIALKGGDGTNQALETSAQVADSWVFLRLREELARARWSGTSAWDALAGLADELALPELAELSDIMRLSGEDSAKVQSSLQARAASLRKALLADEQSRANVASEKMTVPVVLLVFNFLILLAAPSLLRLLSAAP